jgi:DNA-directed RNA polymerase subunit L
MVCTISNIKHDNGEYRFTLGNINVSLANAIRRVILSDIPVCVIHTDTEDNNQCKIEINTSRLHNELIKQRISCIPIHLKDDLLHSLKGKYEMVLDVSNDGDSIVYVTTNDFRLRNKETGVFCTKNQTNAIFPPNNITQDYILLMRLRAKISDCIPGEKIKLTADFSVSTAINNSSFNVVSKCAYMNTPDRPAIETRWNDIAITKRNEGMSDKDIEFDKTNFYILDSQRYYIEDSFDYVVKSIGIYENIEILKMTCMILHDKFAAMLLLTNANKINILRSSSTIDNAFDIILENEDYTMGKVIECLLYKMYYKDKGTISFCGFRKAHPHDTFSIIRIALIDSSESSTVQMLLADVCSAAANEFKTIASLF